MVNRLKYRRTVSKMRTYIIYAVAYIIVLFIKISKNALFVVQLLRDLEKLKSS